MYESPDSSQGNASVPCCFQLFLQSLHSQIQLASQTSDSLLRLLYRYIHGPHGGKMTPLAVFIVPPHVLHEAQGWCSSTQSVGSRCTALLANNRRRRHTVVYERGPLHRSAGRSIQTEGSVPTSINGRRLRK